MSRFPKRALQVVIAIVVVGVIAYGAGLGESVASGLYLEWIAHSEFGPIVLFGWTMLGTAAMVGYAWRVVRSPQTVQERPALHLPEVAERGEALLRMAVEKTAGSGGQVALMRIDLDRAKEIQQMFGHLQGAKVLEAVSDRLAQLLTQDDEIVRINRDEFAVVRSLISGVEEVDDFAVEVLKELSAPLRVGSFELVLGANLGISMASPEVVAQRDLFGEADRALYRSKLHGSNRYEIFDHSLPQEVSPAMIVEWLQQALEQRHLRLHFQPIMDLSQDRIMGVEALLRWEHPVHGLLPPDLVLPALEESGLILEVGRWVISEACQQAREWSERFGSGPPIQVFVNMSSFQLSNTSFIEDIERCLETSGCAADQIVLELGSLGTISHNSPIWSTLRECKALGVRLAIDNFGDNDASFGILRRIRVDYLKLDRRLIRARGATVTDDAVATAIASLSHTIGFSVIAEGVEDLASLERARSLGCEMAQGFFFGGAESGPVVSQMMIEQQLVRNGSTGRVGV